MDKFTDFGKLDGEQAAPEAAVEVEGATTSKNAARKAEAEKMVALLKDKIEKDPTFKGRHCSLSKDVVVINSLGFGDSGNIVVDKNGKAFLGKDGKERLPLERTSQIVGYRVQNIGEKTINYTTEVYKQDENGVFVGERMEKALEPGGFADLSRKYMTMFASMPELSFQLANGKIVRGPGKIKSGDVDAVLESFYFTFSDRSVKVNSDSVKLNISTKKKGADGTVKWVVKDEFVETFGYLNNAKPAGTGRQRAGSRTKWTTQDMAANYIQSLINRNL